MATQPSIVWHQYKILDSASGITASGSSLNNNTVDYNAVQAGQYSPVICVRPQFTGGSTEDNKIGSVRLWWSTTTASTYPGQSTTKPTKDLPMAGWILKYYVSNCKDVIVGESNLASDDQRCGRMLNYLQNQSNVGIVATGKTFTFPNNSLDTTKYCWCKPTWQEDSSTQSSTQSSTHISFQPVPFYSYKESVKQQQDEYNTKYGAAWKSTVFGVTDTNTGDYSDGNALSYAVGGALFSATGGKCNIKKQVADNSQFPYIFFTIKAPTNAEAGTWSGWACRISYIWPYNAS